MATTVQNLLLDESAQDLIEYALIASLLALGAVAALKSLGSSISLFLDSVSSSLASAI